MTLRKGRALVALYLFRRREHWASTMMWRPGYCLSQCARCEAVTRSPRQPTRCPQCGFWGYMDTTRLKVIV